MDFQSDKNYGNIINKKNSEIVKNMPKLKLNK